jgi:hypothetical protein
MNKTYNVGAYGLPAAAIDQVSFLCLELVWSRHAKLEAVNDKYGVLPSLAYPRCFSLRGWELVEVEVNPLGNVVKFVVRRQADEHRSLVLVILRDGPHEGIVKTCWTNLTDDQHETLDKSKFSEP